MVCDNMPAADTEVDIAPYLKSSRASMELQESTSLIQMVCLSQQVKFKDISVNTTDLEKLNKTHSIKLLITELKTNFERYDLLTGFNIIKCVAFLTGELEYNSATNKLRQYDLFPDYCRITVTDVAKSCQ